MVVRSRNPKGEGVNSSSIQGGLKDFVDVPRIISLHDIFTLLQAPFFGSIALEQPVRGRSTRKPTNTMEPSLAHQCSLDGENLRQKQDEQQLKTFTRWWNSWLKVRGIPVTDLCERSRTASSA